ncbi:MAG TPA: hypothetical protein VG345_16615 [Bryobacteraceae bacterium]|jgi:hypothetical protein|nr:hypothetical protein [Bryobacteraceae bacterium]
MSSTAILGSDLSDLAAALVQALQVQPAKIAALPIWLYPSVDSQAFDFVKYAALPAIGAQGVIISFQVPDGMNGIIKRFGNAYVGAGFTEGSGALQWQLLADGAAVPNYENIPASLGATANPSEVSSIRVKEGQLIQLVINNISLLVGGTFSGGRLGGWFYPKDQEPVADWA